jgi:hypothetical protein
VVSIYWVRVAWVEKVTGWDREDRILVRCDRYQSFKLK